MAYLYLFISIILEVAGTTSMKLSEGFTKTVPSVMIFVFYTLSFAVFTYALKKIDLSLSYAIWSGAGTALIALIGIFYFKEPSSLLKIVSIGLIIIGVVGLNLSGAKS